MFCVQMRKNLPKFFDRIKVIHNKDFASTVRHLDYQKHLHREAVKNSSELLYAVRKEFKQVAFVGSNPDAFVENLPQSRYSILI